MWRKPTRRHHSPLRFATAFFAFAFISLLFQTPFLLALLDLFSTRRHIHPSQATLLQSFPSLVDWCGWCPFDRLVSSLRLSVCTSIARVLDPTSRSETNALHSYTPWQILPPRSLTNDQPRPYNTLYNNILHSPLICFDSSPDSSSSSPFLSR